MEPVREENGEEKEKLLLHIYNKNIIEKKWGKSEVNSQFFSHSFYFLLMSVSWQLFLYIYFKYAASHYLS